MILKHLESRPDSLVKTSFLCEKLGIKPNKLQRLLIALQNELFEYDDNPKIIRENDTVTSLNVKLTHVKQLQLKYFLDSMTFLYFCDLLQGRVTPKIFGNRHFLSEGTGYIQQKNIKVFLKEHEIKVRNGRLVGSEIKIRNLFFSILFEVFEGMCSPFPNEMEKKIDSMLKKFEESGIGELSNIQRLKFRLFLGIVIWRIQDNSFLSDEEDYFILSERSYDNLFQQLKKGFSIKDPLVAKREMKYILAFLQAEGVENLSVTMTDEPFREIDRISFSIAKDILTNLHKTESNQAGDFIEALKIVNRNHIVFQYILSSFSSKAQFQYFFEAYPYFSSTIRSTIETHKNQLFFGDSTVLNQLFYEYAFLVNKYFVANELEQPVHIYIEFSLGKLYTQFISDEVSCFKNMNIRVENKLSEKTDLYLSDCMIQGLSAKSLIWKRPPTAEDWQEFGDLVIQIKQEKNNLEQLSA